MSENTAFNFDQFIPGYDFLQQLSKTSQSAASTGLPTSFTNWVAPTVSVEEIDKRIEELKSVQFWLEQNSRGLSATIQALQVQKMTLSTLQDMNVNMSEFAKAFGFGAESSSHATAPTPSAAPFNAQSGGGSTSNASNWPMGGSSTPPTQQAAPVPAASPAPAPSPTAQTQEEDNTTTPTTEEASDPTPALAAQAMQWWGSLTQQFQQIATQVMQDPVHQAAMAQASSMASDLTKAAAQATSDMVRQAVVPPMASTGARANAGASTAESKSTTASTSTAKRKKPSTSTNTTSSGTTRKKASSSTSTTASTAAKKVAKTAASAKSTAQKTSTRKA